MPSFQIISDKNGFLISRVDGTLPMLIHIEESNEFQFEIYKLDSNYEKFTLEYLLQKFIEKKSFKIKIFENIENIDILEGIFFVLNFVEDTNFELNRNGKNEILISGGNKTIKMEKV